MKLPFNEHGAQKTHRGARAENLLRMVNTLPAYIQTRSILKLLTAGFASNSAEKKPAVKASEVYIPIGNTGQSISLLDLSRMSVKDVQSFTGKKMSFGDRMMFKAAQRQLKNSIIEE